MRPIDATVRLLAALACLLVLACGDPASKPPVQEATSDGTELGRRGGRLTAALRAEPGTLNPVLAIDRRAAVVSHLTSADLIHVNRGSQQTEPALAESWEVSEEGTVYTLSLRRDVLFSDGQPFDADDVVFSFEVYLDPDVGAAGRGALIISGEPIRVEKVDSHTVRFEFASPYAAGARLFDSIAMLPEHLLGEVYRNGTFTESWRLGTPPEEIAGLGPFLPAEYRPGESLTLRRNPHYWKRDAAGERLPYLDEIVMLLVPNEDVAAIRFQNGEIDVLDDISGENFTVLERAREPGTFTLHDLGPGIVFNFLFFNQNDLGGGAPSKLPRSQRWFRDREFRRAVSEVADRKAISRLVYGGRATPLGGPVSGGNRLWLNESTTPPERSIERARGRLAAAGFSWDEDDELLDGEGERVDFSIVTNSSNTQRVKIAEILSEDLRQLGIATQVVPLEFQSLVERLLQSHDYEACVLGMGGSDVDPNSLLNLWLSSGPQHLWAPSQSEPATEWEAEIDRLMQAQLVEIDPVARKELYDRVQEILASELPLIFLVSPNRLAGGKAHLGNFSPAILEPSVLWNADRLFWRESSKNLD